MKVVTLLLAFNLVGVCLGADQKPAPTPQAKEPFFAARRSVFPSAPEADHLAEWSFIQQYKPFAVNLALTPDRLSHIQELNIQFQVQKSMLPFNQIADMSLAADALKLLR